MTDIKNTVNQTGALPDAITVIGKIVGLHDFADRADYAPKVMKAKLSECIKDLQRIYHAPNPQPVSAALEAFDRVQQDHNHGIYGNRTVEDHEKDVERVRQALAQVGGEKTLDKSDD
jgi:hypothetical protein